MAFFERLSVSLFSIPLTNVRVFLCIPNLNTCMTQIYFHHHQSKIEIQEIHGVLQGLYGSLKLLLDVVLLLLIFNVVVNTTHSQIVL